MRLGRLSALGVALVPPRVRLRQFLLGAAAALMLSAAGCADEDQTPAGDATGAGTAAAEGTATSGAEAAGGAGTSMAGAEPTSAAGSVQLSELQVALEPVATDLTAPVDLAQPDDGSGRLFLVEQTGAIRVVSEEGELLEEPFLDLSDRLVGDLSEDYDERGLLGLAFHPDYANNGRFFVYYSAPLAEDAPEGWNHTSHLSEFTVDPENPDVAAPDSERIILEVDQSQRNHNGGHIAFGLDGYLYVPLGDGGGGDDVDEGHTPNLGNGQDLANLLGSILRIDVDSPGEGDAQYAIPEDNPFVDGPGGALPEIWAYGLRNPYDISIDPGGEYGVVISDAGQELFEEVSLATEAGQNFGWNIREGTHCFDPQNPESPPEDCPTEGANGEPLVNPVVEYHRADFGMVVVGAHVYRGQTIADLQGRLVFADWNAGGVDGALYVAEPSSNLAATGVDEGLWPFDRLEIATELEGAEEGELGRYIMGLASDASNELYVLVSSAPGPEEDAGEVYRLVPVDAATLN